MPTLILSDLVERDGLVVVKALAWADFPGGDLSMVRPNGATHGPAHACRANKSDGRGRRRLSAFRLVSKCDGSQFGRENSQTETEG